MDLPDDVNLELGAIDPPADPHRERMDPEALGRLADSMAAEGLHQPIGVRGPLAGERYEVMFGHRRYEAAKLLGWARIPARIYAPDTDPLQARASENLQRADLSPLEEARMVRRFIDAGQPQAAVARLLRRSPAWVASRLDLLTLPADLADAVDRRELSIGVADHLRVVDHEAYRRTLIEEARANGCSVATAAVWAAHWAKDRARLVANHSTVAEIMAEAKAFTIYAPCEACADSHPIQETSQLRLCAGCMAAVRAAIRAGVEAEKAAANGQH